jgi:hypothetical protein
MNRIVEEKKEEKEPNKETVKLTERMKRFADFNFSLNKAQLSKQAPFLAYVFLLMVLFIYNSHTAEKNIRLTNKLNTEIKDLRSEYITVLSELMGESRQSAVAKRLEKTGIKEIKTPPSKITYSGN